MPYQVPRGMRDILPVEIGRWQALEERIRALAERFGFRELRTPVVEHTEVFARTSGEARGPGADAEGTGRPIRLMQSLGLAQVEVRLNSIGDPVCRPRYLEALRDYFSRYTDALCADCRRRLQTN